MTQMKLLEEQLSRMPPEMQAEVLSLASSLTQQLAATSEGTSGKGLMEHAAFGSWTGRGIDALAYESERRAEWEPQK